MSINFTKLKFKWRGKVSLFAFFVSLFLILNSCEKSNILGSDLISDEWIHAKGVDSFAIGIQSYQQDSLLIAYSVLPNAYFLGKMKDPVFGISECGFVSQLRFTPVKEVDFLSLPIDSIVLALRYELNGFYGDTALSHTVEVYELEDSLSRDQRFYQGFSAKFKPNVLGKLENFIPNRKDTVQVKLNNVINYFNPQLRISLDTGVFMNRMRSMTDSSFASVDSFLKQFYGIGVISTKEAGMMSLLPISEQSRITIYYHEDTVQYEFVFNMGPFATKAPIIKLDHDQRIKDYIANTVNGDSIAYIQGLTGPDMKLSVPYYSSWDTGFLNHAVLEFYVAVNDVQDTGFFSPIDLMYLQDLESGKPQDIRDFIIAKSISNQLTNIGDFVTVFGGSPRRVQINNETLYKYSFNITAHFQKVRKEKKGLELLVTPLFKTETARRVKLYGNKHSKYPAKLKLIYSE